MRSDEEDIPGGFTKQEADQAETQEAAEQSGIGRSGFRAAAPNCQTYWPSPYQVCGAIRDKYNSIGGPTSFLTWPKSNELTVPDRVGRRSEFLNGHIYWHPSTGAHTVSTHFAVIWQRNGWEAGFMGYPTSDEIILADGIGRKQDFQGSHAYGSLAGLAQIGGAIYDKWASTGAETGPLGYPTSDELHTPDGVGRYNRFVGGMAYWTPRTGAHTVRGDILDKWAAAGYETGQYGYPVEDEQPKGNVNYIQRFERGSLEGSSLADIVWSALPMGPDGKIPGLTVPLIGTKTGGRPPFAACPANPNKDQDKVIKSWVNIDMGVAPSNKHFKKVDLTCGRKSEKGKGGGVGYRHILEHKEWESAAQVSSYQATQDVVHLALRKTLEDPERSYATTGDKYCSQAQLYLTNQVRGQIAWAQEVTTIVSSGNSRVVTTYPASNCSPQWK